MQYTLHLSHGWFIRMLVLLNMCLIAVVFAPVRAQEIADFPAYLASSGDLYQWTPGEDALQPVTACDLDGNKVLSLSLSPTGTHMAMNVVSEAVFNGGYAPSPVGNLWLCDLVNRTTRAITDVDVGRVSLSRSGVWSPDGTLLAWSGVNDGESAAIFIYDLASETTTTLVENTPLDSGCGVGPFPPALTWGETGIAVGYFILSETDPCGPQPQAAGIYVYDIQGERIADLPVGPVGQIFWDYEAGDNDRLIFFQKETVEWQTVTLDDGTVAAVGIPQGYLPAIGDDSPTVTRIGVVRRVMLPGMTMDQAFEPMVSAGIFNIGFSPDGMAALFQLESGVYSVINGEIARLTLETDNYYLGNDIAWSPLRYRIANNAVVEASICSAVPPFFYPDYLTRVVAGLGANNLRVAPLSDAERIGEIPEGAVAEVVFLTDVCSGGIRWRYVTYEGVSGWTAESQGETYYLETPTD